ncbi:methylmalonyl-CoA mutase family protein [Neobacillus cucumis]|uniref:Methylmalonyl-CoA mutase n=1 Tax=Neobacillus cucumis TaxID=1740721 RepID=A0A2N5H860_9BACI|nr:methylmalonyl-CoA mutase family protein [Neobacillus cucumis]PLS01680.1 methylmalonyl-CoA mutase [Neobacillus cucumis]
MKKLKEQSFSSKTINDWKATAETSLKQKKIESLNCHTYENIVLKPLYTREDEQIVPDYSGGSDYRRGIYPLGYITNKWEVAQQVSYRTSDELKKKLHEMLEKGQTTVAFEVSEELFETNDSFLGVLGEFYHVYPLAINSYGWQTKVLSMLSKLTEDENKKEKITGYIASDPIALFAEEGAVSKEFIEEWKRTIIQAGKEFPSLSTILIDTIPYHNGGANAVQELGIAIAEGVFYLDSLQEDKMELNQILKNMVFQFSIGSNFFMEIAKLRAARVLWNRITELYGAKDESRAMIISAVTSNFTKSIQDPYVNLLRAGNEAFAAVIGGVQYLHVTPFNSLTGSTPLSERIARNMQLLLKQEALLDKVIDPAGGSWYVEKLTNELAEKAWEYFQQMEAGGGILNVLKSNWLQEDIKAVFDQKILDIQTRKQSMIGTNVYADVNENNLSPIKMNRTNFFKDGTYSLTEMEVISERRLSEPFENLRRRAKRLEEKTGTIPSVGMICLGEMKEHKPRTDFMKGFFAAGGLKAVESNPIISLEKAKQFILETSTSYFCFCGTNEQYELTGQTILTALKSEFPEHIFYLAGLPETGTQFEWEKEGIKQFIHVKSNCYKTLNMILTDMEVNTVEEKKA